MSNVTPRIVAIYIRRPITPSSQTYLLFDEPQLGRRKRRRYDGVAVQGHQYLDASASDESTDALTAVLARLEIDIDCNTSAMLQVRYEAQLAHSLEVMAFSLLVPMNELFEEDVSKQLLLEMKGIVLPPPA